jgi:hypothetical protein
MALTLSVTGTKTAGGGVELQLSVNGQPYAEGRVYESVAAALEQIDSHPMTVDDLLWLILRVARARGWTAAQIRNKVITVDLNSPNVVTIA